MTSRTEHLAGFFIGLVLVVAGRATTPFERAGTRRHVARATIASPQCSLIRDDDQRHLCEGACSLIRDDDLRHFCARDCSLIRNDDLRHRCGG